MPPSESGGTPVATPLLGAHGLPIFPYILSGSSLSHNNSQNFLAFTPELWYNVLMIGLIMTEEQLIAAVNFSTPLTAEMHPIDDGWIFSFNEYPNFRLELHKDKLEIAMLRGEFLEYVRSCMDDFSEFIIDKVPSDLTQSFRPAPHGLARN